MNDFVFLKKEFYSSLASEIVNSFKLATKGKENIDVLIWRWGIASYLLAFFIFFDLATYLNKSATILALILSLLVSSYFIWHIYAVFKCSPKKAKLSKAEKKQKKLVENKSFSKSFFRKLMLQEPWIKTRKTTFSIIIDLLCLAYFAEFIF